MSQISPLQAARYAYVPRVPRVLKDGVKGIAVKVGEVTQSAADQEVIKSLFPLTYGQPEIDFVNGPSTITAKRHKVGVILSGGPAPGGHNVICGLYDALKAANPENELIGFKGGPKGLIDDKYVYITDEMIESRRNTGGFDLFGSGRDKIETPEQFEKVAHVVADHGLTAVVIIGGDDSNTNAAVLAEFFAKRNAGVQIIGCPKTIDGDLKNEDIEASFGFDTATKTYSELIGNIERDANSSKKYWHFIKVMGRAASHVALECALQTQPNICFVGEEVAAKGLSLQNLTDQIADAVAARAENGENFGVVVIPEGIIEFIPEVSVLIREINEMLAGGKTEEFNALPTWKDQLGFIKAGLTEASYAVFSMLPEEIQKQLFLERDPHGNVQVSLIESEKLFAQLVKNEMKKRKEAGTYVGKFGSQHHFFGYEGRCGFPSNFDADYCYCIGYDACLLVLYGFNGYMSRIANIGNPVDEWTAGGMPLLKMMDIERRNGKDKPVIRKCLVDLNGKPFQYFAEHRAQWAVETAYTYPGAIQYFGPAEVCDIKTRSLTLEYS